MSNPNSPSGFQWIGWNQGGPAVTGGTIERKIAAGNTSPICHGDLVQQLSTGYVAISAAGVAGSLTVGVFLGCKYLSTSQGRVVYSNYWPSGDHAYDGTAIIMPIAGVPPQQFTVQALLTNFTFADVGANCDISVGTQVIAGGNGTSGMTLDRSTIGTTATLPFRIVGMYSSIAPYGTSGTDDTSSYNRVIVQSNPANVVGINT
jgi:hypothetical protein